MISRLNTQNQRTKKETQDLSNTPVQGMFQPRPFVMQRKAAKKAHQPDLNTSLMRSEKYGHRLNQIDSNDQSSPTALQMKVGTRQPIQFAPAITFDKFGDKRPRKPNELKGKDSEGGDLTAHHKIPYTNIMNAVESEDPKVRANVAEWANHKRTKTGPLSKPEVAWPLPNMFMGPKPEDRADDPGDGIDSHLTKSGTVTPKSEAALRIEAGGGFGINGEELKEKLKLVQDNKHSPYDKNEWEKLPIDKNKKIGKPKYQQIGGRIAGEKYGTAWGEMTLKQKVDYTEKRQKEKNGEFNFQE